jgi:hypothetical protein
MGKAQPAAQRGERAQPLSAFTQDHEDWQVYYVNRLAVLFLIACHSIKSYGCFKHRFVDRDMVMRYHWGLGVGHLYAHCYGNPPQPCALNTATATVQQEEENADDVVCDAADVHCDETMDLNQDDKLLASDDLPQDCASNSNELEREDHESDRGSSSDDHDSDSNWETDSDDDSDLNSTDLEDDSDLDLIDYDDMFGGVQDIELTRTSYD